MEIIDSLQIIVIIINILIVTVSSNGKNVNQINDQRLYRQQQRLLQLYQQQCFNINKENQQSISIEQFFTTFNQCARPHLIRANFIPVNFFSVDLMKKKLIFLNLTYLYFLIIF